MIVREIFAKSVLSKSQIYDSAINPYVGRSHSCRYCYAIFMKRFTGHKEKWGEFVDVKINAPVFLLVLRGRQLHCEYRGYIWVRSRCDPQVCSTPLRSLCQEYLALQVTLCTSSSYMGELPNSHGRTLTDKSYVLHGIPKVGEVIVAKNEISLIFRCTNRFVRRFQSFSETPMPHGDDHR